MIRLGIWLGRPLVPRDVPSSTDEFAMATNSKDSTSNLTSSSLLVFWERAPLQGLYHPVLDRIILTHDL